MKTFNEWIVKEMATSSQMLSSTKEQMKSAGGIRSAAGLDVVDKIIQNMDPSKWTKLTSALRQIAGPDEEIKKLVDELSKYKTSMLATARANMSQSQPEPQAQAQAQTQAQTNPLASVGNPVSQNLPNR